MYLFFFNDVIQYYSAVPKQLPLEPFVDVYLPFISPATYTDINKFTPDASQSICK